VSHKLGDAWADTTTPHCRLMLTVLGGLAEFERDLIRARTGARSYQRLAQHDFAANGVIE
jgi:DNA invertase Pin-like site-specific DNA recombinase